MKKRKMSFFLVFYLWFVINYFVEQLVEEWYFDFECYQCVFRFSWFPFISSTKRSFIYFCFDLDSTNWICQWFQCWFNYRCWIWQRRCNKSRDWWVCLEGEVFWRVDTYRLGFNIWLMIWWGIIDFNVWWIWFLWSIWLSFVVNTQWWWWIAWFGIT